MQKYVIYHTESGKYLNFSDDKKWAWDANTPFLFVPVVVQSMYEFFFSGDLTLYTLPLATDVLTTLLKVNVEHLMVYPCDVNYELHINDGIKLKLWSGDG